jgi:hypothetical protein
MSEEIKPISQIVDEELAKVQAISKHVKTDSITIASDLGRKIVSNAVSRYDEQFRKLTYSEDEVIILLQKYRYDLSSGTTPNLGDTTPDWFKQFLKQKSNG